MKIAASEVDSRVVVWVREFLFGRSQRVRVGGHFSDEGRVTAVVPQWSVLGPLLFLACINDIWRNLESTITLFADDCIIYRKVINDDNIDTLQIDLDIMSSWAIENTMLINPSKSAALSFTKARAKDPLIIFGGQKNSRGESLQVLRSNHTQRYKLEWSC